MPLSREEQRVLDEIERALLVDDPDLARRTRPRRRRRLQVRIPRIWLALAGLLAGTTLIVVGLLVVDPVHIALAVSGFVVLVATCWFAVTSFRRRRARADSRPRPPM